MWCVADPYSDYNDDDDDDDEGGRRLSCLYCGPFDLDHAFLGTKCESTSCGVSDCTDAAPARRISVAAAVAALVSVLIA